MQDIGYFECFFILPFRMGLHPEDVDDAKMKFSFVFNPV